MKNHAVSIICDDIHSPLCRSLCKSLSATIVSSGTAIQTPYVLRVEGEGLFFSWVDRPDFKPISLDFNRTRNLSSGDPLVRAIGRKSKRIIDATAGWGSDAVHLAGAGKTVVALEKNAIIYAMLYHAWGQIRSAALKSRLHFVRINSERYLGRMNAEVDAIYLDPMFPIKEKSSKSKKNLQILQDIVGESVNQKRLLEIALTRASRRVVVKRPHYAPPIQSGKVGEIKTKLIRFDIYQPGAA